MDACENKMCKAGTCCTKPNEISDTKQQKAKFWKLEFPLQTLVSPGFGVEYFNQYWTYFIALYFSEGLQPVALSIQTSFMPAHE
jgi:hypothetical protein